MSNLQLGWVGLGNMGTPIVKNLLKAGYKVTVFNRTKEKEKEVLDAGASSVDTPAQLAECCDVILTMVSDDKAVKEVFEGENGLLNDNIADKLLIDLSTVSPDTSRYLEQISKQKGAEFLDSPVSGSVKPAQDGTLIMLVGGSAENYEKAKPVLDIIGKLSLHLGPVGAGSSAKLAINYFLGVTLQGFAETVLFAQQNGVSVQDMLTIINEGACGSGITKLKSQNILNNSFPAAFALKHLTKDLRLASEQKPNAPLLAPLLNTFQQAQQSGLGDEDVMAVIKFLEHSAVKS